MNSTKAFLLSSQNEGNSLAAGYFSQLSSNVISKSLEER